MNSFVYREDAGRKFARNILIYVP